MSLAADRMCANVQFYNTGLLCIFLLLRNYSNETLFAITFMSLIILKNFRALLPISRFLGVPISAFVHMHQMIETLTIFVFDFLKPKRFIRLVWYAVSGRLFSFTLTFTSSGPLFLLKPMQIEYFRFKYNGSKEIA